jgi:hypothetical protein
LLWRLNPFLVLRLREARYEVVPSSELLAHCSELDVFA